MTTPIPIRAFLIPARDAPVAIVLRQGPAKLWHVLKWNTQKDVLEAGSWFHGRLHLELWDLSFDGEWMIYEATGSGRGSYERWVGLCQPPWLRTAIHWDGDGEVGRWRDRDTLVVDVWYEHLVDEVRAVAEQGRGTVPFRIEVIRGGLIEEVRLGRVGWNPSPNEKKVWTSQPSAKHPSLVQRGPLGSATFELFGRESILDQTVTDATWNAKGDLLVARAGWIERYTLADLARGVPTFRYDLNPLQPPPRSAPK